MKNIVDIIAPSGSFPLTILPEIAAYLKQFGFEARIPSNILGHDLLCANTDNVRFELLKEALYNDESDLIWCVRGGYGAARLLDKLNQLDPPKHKKTLIGFSDITALHLFLTQKWGWQTIHGPSIRQLVEKDITKESIEKALLFLQTGTVSLQQQLTPLNDAAHNVTLHGVLSGGNLKLTECSLATFWALNPADKILMLEDVNEQAYRIDRVLLHLRQAQVFEKVKAVVLGEFNYSDSKEEAQIFQVLKRFAEELAVPIFHAPFFGHGQENILWKYAPAEINAGVLTQ